MIAKLQMGSIMMIGTWICRQKIYWQIQRDKLEIDDRWQVDIQIRQMIDRWVDR